MKGNFEVIINVLKKPNATNNKTNKKPQLQNLRTMPCNERQRLNLFSIVMCYGTEIKMCCLPVPNKMTVKQFPVK